MKYRLLAFDLDGTLTNSDKIVTPRTKAAIYKAREEGSIIALASGRPVYGIVPVAKELGLFELGGYILAYNGGCVIDCKTNETIYEKKVPSEYIKDICRFATDNDYAILTYEGDCIITNKPDNRYVAIEAKINRLPVKEICDMAEHITFPVNKFLITEDPDTVNHLIPVLREMFPKLNIFTSAPYFLEIVPPDIDKSDTLAFLLDYNGLSPESLAAFGDGGNDINMLKRAGLGIAMSNADEQCKCASDYITASNDEDGCGIAIEKMLCGEL